MSSEIAARSLHRPPNYLQTKRWGMFFYAMLCTNLVHSWKYECFDSRAFSIEDHSKIINFIIFIEHTVFDVSNSFASHRPAKMKKKKTVNIFFPFPIKTNHALWKKTWQQIKSDFPNEWIVCWYSFGWTFCCSIIGHLRISPILNIFKPIENPRIWIWNQ